MLKAILWDNDGVLVDTEPLYFKASRDVLAQSGFPLTEDLYQKISLVQGGSVLELARRKGLTSQEIGKLRIQRDEMYGQLLEKGIRVQGTLWALLEKLHKTIKMGIVTSSQKKHFDIIHRQTNLLQFFQFVLTREDYQKSKPHPEPYLKGLQLIGVSPEECIVIEDTERGLKSALGAGLRCIVMPHAFSRENNFSGSYRVCRDIKELERELLTLLD